MKRSTSQQHLKMAGMIGAKAKRASGKKQKRLMSLEAAHRLFAKTLGSDQPKSVAVTLFGPRGI
jgi:hypothetical protein